MKIPQQIKNVLFDMDDVLVRTRALDKQIKENIFASLNLQWNQISPYSHLSIKEMLPLMFNYFQIKQSPNKYAQLYFNEYNKALAENIKENAVSGAAYLVKLLFEKNYSLALVTSSTLEQAQIVCQGLGLSNLFKAIITANDITHSKPHPQPYQKAIEELKASLKECLVIEDLPTGIMSAKAVSPQVLVLAITTTNSRDKLQQADFIIDHFGQIEI